MEHTITPMTLPIGQIKPNKLNPREDFPAEEIAELAESIKRHGLVQPLAVVRNGKGYELLAGERRLRACKKARLKEVRCEVHDGLLTQEKVELILIENLQRKDLNAIEEARGFEQLNKDWNYTQQEIADKIGRDRSLVAQRLGLLRLPEDWQTRVVTGVTPASFARALVPWSNRPNVLAEIAKEEKRHPSETLETFQRTVAYALRHCSRSMRQTRWAEWCSLESSSDCAFKPTKEQMELLDIVEVNLYGRKDRRAFNVQLWKSLQGAALKKHRERQAKRNAKATSNGRPKPSKQRESNAADQRRLFERRVWYYVYDWKQVQVAKALKATRTGRGSIDPAILRVLLWFASGWDHVAAPTGTHLRRSESLSDREQDLELACGGGAADPRLGRWDYIDELTPQALANLARDYVTRLVANLEVEDQEDWDAGTGRLPGPVIDSLFEMLELKIESLWELTEEFCSLHTKEQLAALGDELGVGVNPNCKKQGLINALVAAKPRRVPKIVTRVKEPK